MAISPNLSNLTSTDFSVIAMVPFALPAASATFLRSVSFLSVPFQLLSQGVNQRFLHVFHVTN